MRIFYIENNKNWVKWEPTAHSSDFSDLRVFRPKLALDLKVVLDIFSENYLIIRSNTH